MLLLTNTQNLKKGSNLFSEMHSVLGKSQEMSVFPQTFFKDEISLLIEDIYLFMYLLRVPR